MASKYNVFWRPQNADEGVMGNAMDRLRDVGETMVGEIKKGIKGQNFKHGTKERPVYDRPVYKTGKYPDKYWTARRAGSTEYSVRMVEEAAGKERNVMIMVGNTKVYYTKILESKSPFFRPAINRGKRKAKKIFRGK